MMNTDDFDTIELEVMKKILSDGSVEHEILFEQYRNRIQASREINQCGWYTHFIIRDTKRIAEQKQMRLGNVVLPIAGMEYGIGFVLHVAHGQIDTLEAYTFEENLPNDLIDA